MKKTGDRGLPVWPAGKPIPRFKSYEEETRFWNAHDFEAGPDEDWEEEVKYVPRATRAARKHVFRLRFDDQEMATLQTIARRQGVSMAGALRDLVRSQAPVKTGRRTA